MALTSDGALLINVAYVAGLDDPQKTLDAIPKGARVFVGVLIDGKIVGEILRRIDDAAAEIAGTNGAQIVSAASSASVRGGAPRSSGPSKDRQVVPARRRSRDR